MQDLPAVPRRDCSSACGRRSSESDAIAHLPRDSSSCSSTKGPCAPAPTTPAAPETHRHAKKEEEEEKRKGGRKRRRKVGRKGGEERGEGEGRKEGRGEGREQGREKRGGEGRKEVLNAPKNNSSFQLHRNISLSFYHSSSNRNFLIGKQCTLQHWSECFPWYLPSLIINMFFALYSCRKNRYFNYRWLNNIYSSVL